MGARSAASNAAVARANSTRPDGAIGYVRSGASVGIAAAGEHAQHIGLAVTHRRWSTYPL
jgi:hypothetical protein